MMDSFLFCYTVVRAIVCPVVNITDTFSNRINNCYFNCFINGDNLLSIFTVVNTIVFPIVSTIVNIKEIVTISNSNSVMICFFSWLLLTLYSSNCQYDCRKSFSLHFD